MRSGRRRGALCVILLIALVSVPQPVLSAPDPWALFSVTASPVRVPLATEFIVDDGEATGGIAEFIGAGGVECAGGSVDPRDGRFTFQENGNENGCASVRVALLPPAGTSEAVIRFVHDRAVEGTGTGQHHFVEAMRLWAFEETVPREEATLSAPAEGDVVARAHEIVLSLAGVQEPVLEWRFFEQGHKIGESGARGDVAASSRISEILIVYPDVPVVTEAPRTVSRTVEGLDELRLEERLFYVDEAWVEGAGERRWVTLRLSVPAELGGRVSDPAGQQWEPQGGMLEIEVRTPAQVGAWRVEGLVVVPATASPLVVVPAFLVALAPFVSASPRDLWSRRRSAGGDKATLVVLGTWTAVLAVTMALGRIHLMATWPLGLIGLALWGTAFAVTGSVVTVRVRRAGRRLHESRSKETVMRARAEELETSLYGATHDMKTPLLVLDWLTTDLEKALVDARDDPEVRETLGRIRSTVGGMDRLVQELLLLAQVESESVEVTTVDVSQIVADVVAEHRGAPASAGSTIEVEVSGRLVMHAAHLRHVVANLVSNAIKYGGHEVIVRVTGRSTEGGYELAVEDDGPGIPPGEEEALFEVFRRGSNSSGSPGTGLGLAMVRRVVSRYGGSVTVTGSDHGGARFLVTLPSR